MGIQNLLPLPMALARAGLHVVTCTSRYPNNDSCLIMEKVSTLIAFFSPFFFFFFFFFNLDFCLDLPSWSKEKTKGI